MNKILIKSKHSGASIIILVFSTLALMGLAAFAIDLSIVLNQRYELQKAVESSALITASEYETYEVPGASTLLNIPSAALLNAVGGRADLDYKALKNANQMLTTAGIDASPTVTVYPATKSVVITANALVPTYVINLLGIKKIAISARAAAVNIPAYLSPTLPLPTGSILNGTSAGYRDTEIKDPLGSVEAATMTITNRNTNLNNLFGPPDGKVVSLGPGGYITIKLPTLLTDGKGADFIIFERGNAEGYFVYAGIDTDPANPYSDASNPGSGISWVNVSCTGIPLYVNKNNADGLKRSIGAYRTSVNILGVATLDYKFYGSGMFDLGAKCDNVADGTIYDGTGSVAGAPRINNVKYLKIIDDNNEDGFFLQPRFGLATPDAVPVIFVGEHSSFTPGADLDAIAILHHSRLISTTAAVPAVAGSDTDLDNLINPVEQSIGTNPAAADTDGDGVSDYAEYFGYNPGTMNPLQAATSSVLFMDSPTSAVVPPTIEIDN